MWNPIRRQINLLNMKALGLKLRPLTHNHMTHPKTAKKKQVGCFTFQSVSSWLSGWFLTKLYADTQRFFSLRFLFLVFLHHSPFICASSHRERVWLPSFSHIAEAGKDWFSEISQRKGKRDTHTALSILTADTNTKSCWWSVACSQTVQSPFMDLMMHFAYRNGKGLIACSNLIGWLKIK